MLSYNVSVVHSRDAMMSAVTLSNTHVRAIAHLISNNQLPTPCLLSDVSSPTQRCRKNDDTWRGRGGSRKPLSWPIEYFGDGEANQSALIRMLAKYHVSRWKIVTFSQHLANSFSHYHRFREEFVHRRWIPGKANVRCWSKMLRVTTLSSWADGRFRETGYSKDVQVRYCA